MSINMGSINKLIWLYGVVSVLILSKPLAAQDETSAFLQIFGKPLKQVDTSKLSDLEKKKIQLGKVLYFEKRLSRDNSISCNSCHDTQKFGVDGEAFSIGFKNHLTGRNSPTSFNAFMHVAQFWDGRAPTVEEQAKGPILAAGEMAMPSAEAVVEKLKGIRGYKRLFKKAFPDSKDPITYDNVGKAIGAYERLFVTPSKFDKALAGDNSALNDQEKAGLKTFVTSGCVACHTGNLLGGNMYQKVGLVSPWPNQKDQGRFDLTKKEEDKMMFKVPSLRNIEHTGPYFHDASAKTLPEAIAKMAKHQIGKELTKKEINDMVAFFKTLSGELPKAVAAAPKKFPGQKRKAEESNTTSE